MPLSVPALNVKHSDLAVWNVVMSCAGQRLTICGEQTDIAFAPLENSPTDGRLLELRLDGNPIGWARVDTFPFASLCEVDLDVSDLNSVSHVLSDALQEGMLTTVLGLLPERVGTRLRVGAPVAMAALDAAERAGDLQWFCIWLGDASDNEIAVTFAASAVTICAVLSNSALRPSRVHRNLAHLITTRAERFLGYSTLSLQELRGLRPGDYILFDDAGCGSRHAILAEGLIHVFKAVDDKWVCASVLPFDHRTSIPISTGSVMQDSFFISEGEAEDSDTGRLAPAPLQLTVAFCLGSTRVALSDLESWQAGTVVPLPEALTADEIPVAVSLNGQRFAYGDLVRMDDRLAVRLNRVLLATPDQGHER